MKTIVAADLFAGAGGTSTALAQACEALGLKLKLTAINHWDTAVATHAANHPEAAHVCETLDSVDPRRLIGRQLDVLCASPECVHHSNARGGKPCDDQSRATPWHVLRWAEALRPKAIFVENVREMMSWGPLDDDGRPIKGLRGQTFEAWKGALASLGYKVTLRLVNAADFGGATTRTRLFVIAARGDGPVPWPNRTHAKEPDGTLRPWRAASEVLDWDLPGTSIFGRKRPLKANTMKRIAEGIRRFWGVADPEAFLGRIAAGHGGTVDGTQPFLMSAGGPRVGPLPTSRPMNTALTRDHMALVQPFVVGTGQPNARGPYVYAQDRPLPTATSADDHAVVQPFMVPANYGERAGQRPRTHDVDHPMPTVVGSVTHGLVQPFLVKYYGTGVPHTIEDPLDTFTTNDRYGLVQPVVVDVLFRMLQPHELAAAMGFPAGYAFQGNRGDVVKQIGNAVSVEAARSHLEPLLRGVA